MVFAFRKDSFIPEDKESLASFRKIMKTFVKRKKDNSRAGIINSGCWQREHACKVCARLNKSMIASSKGLGRFSSRAFGPYAPALAMQVLGPRFKSTQPVVIKQKNRPG